MLNAVFANHSPQDPLPKSSNMSSRRQAQEANPSNLAQWNRQHLGVITPDWNCLAKLGRTPQLDSKTDRSQGPSSLNLARTTSVEPDQSDRTPHLDYQISVDSNYQVISLRQIRLLQLTGSLDRIFGLFTTRPRCNAPVVKDDG